VGLRCSRSWRKATAHSAEWFAVRLPRGRLARVDLGEKGSVFADYLLWYVRPQAARLVESRPALAAPAGRAPVLARLRFAQPFGEWTVKPTALGGRAEARAPSRLERGRDGFRRIAKRRTPELTGDLTSWLMDLFAIKADSKPMRQDLERMVPIWRPEEVGHGRTLWQASPDGGRDLGHIRRNDEGYDRERERLGAAAVTLDDFAALKVLADETASRSNLPRP
jgi:hypothetical protein